MLDFNERIEVMQTPDMGLVILVEGYKHSFYLFIVYLTTLFRKVRLYRVLLFCIFYVVFGSLHCHLQYSKHFKHFKCF
jgi:hypothetical protein